MITAAGLQSNDFVIREAEPDDVIGIVYVQATTWIDHYPNEEHGIAEKDIRAIDWQSKIPSWQHMVKSPDYIVWVAASDQEILGFMSMADEDDLFVLGTLYVLPEHQDSGIGEQLLDKAKELADKTQISLQVAAYNDKAIDFYKKHGFVLSGSQGGAYTLPGGKTIPTVQMHWPEPESGSRGGTVTRKQLAEVSDQRESTIKWYSEIGILPYLQKAPGLRRYYQLQPSLRRLRQIRDMQESGLSIDEIRRKLTG